MTERARLMMVVVLLLVGAGLSGLLLLEHHGVGSAASAVSQLCGEGPESGCAQVSRSPYARVAGVPLAAFGLVFYLSLCLLIVIALAAEAELTSASAATAFALLALGLALDLVLFGLQAFVIHAFCRLCLGTYAVTAAALALLWPVRRTVGAVPAHVRSAMGRLAFGSWLAGSLLVGVVVLGDELALRSREAQQAAALLGTPLPAASAAAARAPAALPTAAPPTSGPEDPAQLRADARQARDEAKRLQGILDDPQKLQQYMDEKAAREFDEARPLAVDLTATPFRGPTSAPIKVLAYSDFLCPYCRSLAGALANYIPQSAGRVAIYYKNYPLDTSCNPNLKQSVHAGACWLALGAICAQGQGKFWPYHDKVFGSTLTDPKREDVLKLADEIGLAGSTFEACLSSPNTRSQLSADLDEAKRVGVQATPTVLVNGRKLPRINDFLRAIEKESERLHLPPLPSPTTQ